MPASPLTISGRDVCTILLHLQEASPNQDFEFPCLDSPRVRDEVRRVNRLYLKRPGVLLGVFGSTDDFRAGFDEIHGRPLKSGSLEFWKDIELQMKREFLGCIDENICCFQTTKHGRFGTLRVQSPRIPF